MPFSSTFGRRRFLFIIVVILLPFFSFFTPKKALAQFVVELGPASEGVQVDTNVQVTDSAISLTEVSDVELPAVVANTGVAAVNSTAQHVKSFSLDGLATYAARLIIRQLTASTVKWINSGFNGNPTYVTNPTQFFGNIADQVAGQYISGTALNFLCSPFQVKIKLALAESYTNGNRPSCTLSKVINNFDTFTQHFSQGGWDGWFSMTQNTQNNPVGAYLDAQDQLGISIGNAQKKYSDQLNWGSGFLSYEKCPDGKLNSQVDAANVTADTDYSVDPNGCSVETETVTPGSVIAEKFLHLSDSSIDELNVTNSINQIVSALLTQMISQLVGGIGNGLRGLTQGGSSSLQAQMTQGSSQATAEDQAILAGIQANSPSNAISNGPVNPNAPFIILNGLNPMNLSIGDNFSDPGATAFDATDGDISNHIISSSTVPLDSKSDIKTAGAFTVTYTVTNSQGITSNPVIRNVVVTATSTPPQEGQGNGSGVGNQGGSSATTTLDTLSGGSAPLSIHITSPLTNSGGQFSKGSSQTVSWFYSIGSTDHVNAQATNVNVYLWDSVTYGQTLISALGDTTQTSIPWTVQSIAGGKPSDLYYLQICEGTNASCVSSGTFTIN